MMDFKTASDYYLFIEVNKRFISEIEDLSSDKYVYSYVYNKKQVAFFNFEKNHGWLKNYEDAKGDLRSSGVNLRTILACQLSGLEYSRQNYLDKKNFFLSFQKINRNQYVKSLESLCILQLDIEGGISQSTIMSLNEKLNSMSNEKRIEYEIPILLLFTDYAYRLYNNSIKTSVKKNFLCEEYYGISIINKYGNEIDLSEIVFRVVFPDFDRDDFDREEDVRVDLNSIKGYIDYNNSNKYFKIQK